MAAKKIITVAVIVTTIIIATITVIIITIAVIVSVRSIYLICTSYIYIYIYIYIYVYIIKLSNYHIIILSCYSSTIILQFYIYYKTIYLVFSIFQSVKKCFFYPVFLGINAFSRFQIIW